MFGCTFVLYGGGSWLWSRDNTLLEGGREKNLVHLRRKLSWKKFFSARVGGRPSLDPHLPFGLVMLWLDFMRPPKSGPLPQTKSDKRAELY